MDIENMNIEKATERCNQLIKQEHANWIGISNQVAIIRVLNELEKKEAIINEMAKHIHLSGDYECLNKECEDDGDISCEDCIKEYFYKKVKETKDNGSTRNF